MQFSTGAYDWLMNKLARPESSNEVAVGKIHYSSGEVGEIRVPSQNAIQYGINVTPQPAVQGVHIDSHRPPSVYKQVPHIPTSAINKSNIAQSLNKELRQFYQSGSSREGTLFHIKSALIAMSLFGHGNETMEADYELIDLFKGFEEKLRIILPKSLGFERLIIRMPEVLLSTRSGDFVVDAASGGVIKLFEITWQIYFFSQQKKHFVVTMDEPENHLHPSMQRTFLRNLMDAFPKSQFIVVTHSPFIVSSVKDSSVYVLNYVDVEGITEPGFDEDQSVRGLMGARVDSQKLDTVNRAGTAAQILREALGVSTTIPQWADERTKEIIEGYKNQPITSEALDRLTAQLESEGLVSEIPAAIKELTQKK
ncbi:AAA family ATPase [Nioella nitratireducens]|uniref:AAA family ATPase n=1 Tax=Nioella nitratireducens TaxID=1287720 RepID=UPI001F2E813F|nr:AAA family ATPase [Nioella nitratireducens]